MNKYLGLDKLRLMVDIFRKNGGWLKGLKKLYIMDDLLDGREVGTDRFGNRYYENHNYYPIPRDRWVEYAPHFRLEYDASQVCPEWHGWLHHRTDFPPHQEAFRPKHRWLLPYEENLTGTTCSYVPYSTTRPKIHPWIPPKNLSKKKKQ